MTQEAKEARNFVKLREEAVEQSKRLLVDAERIVDRIENACAHQWTDPKYTPIIREGYRDPGDPPGTMGIDWRGPQYIPRSETPKWTRECQVCGKVETTTNTNEKVVKIPRF